VDSGLFPDLLVEDSNPLPLLEVFEDAFVPCPEELFDEPTGLEVYDAPMEELMQDAMAFIESDLYGQPEDLSFLPQMRD